MCIVIILGLGIIHYGSFRCLAALIRSVPQKKNMWYEKTPLLFHSEIFVRLTFALLLECTEPQMADHRDEGQGHSSVAAKKFA